MANTIHSKELNTHREKIRSNHQVDIEKNIKKLLFEMDVSNYKVSKETGIAQTTLSRFTRKESDIDNMSLKNALALNDYYLKLTNKKL